MKANISTFCSFSIWAETLNVKCEFDKIHISHSVSSFYIFGFVEGF